jgi:hypothetical protein
MGVRIYPESAAFGPSCATLSGRKPDLIVKIDRQQEDPIRDPELLRRAW